MNLQGTLQGASSAKGKISIPSVRDGSSIRQYSSVYEFPNRGSVSALYIDINSNACYRWDEENSKYFCVGRDYTEIKIISGGEA